MLGAYDVKYMPWTAKKGQILADFVVEFTEDTMEKEEKALGVIVMLASLRRFLQAKHLIKRKQG